MGTRSGDSSATALTWFHEWAVWVLLGNPLLPAGERGGGKWFRVVLLLRPRDWETAPFLMFWVSLAARPTAGGTKQNNNNKILHLALPQVREGWLAISRRAVSSFSRSPVSGPFAPAHTARFGGGLERLGDLPVAGSMTLPVGWLLWQRGSGGSCREAPMATSRLRGCSRVGKQQVTSDAWCVWSPQSASVLPRTAVAMLSTASPKRPVCDTGSFRNCTFLLLHVSETQPEMALLDH